MREGVSELVEWMIGNVRGKRDDRRKRERERDEGRYGEGRSSSWELTRTVRRRRSGDLQRILRKGTVEVKVRATVLSVEYAPI